jgi:hypothetical protein
MAMYDIRIYDGKTNSPPYVLVQDLINAHERGVKVLVYLDNSRRYTGADGVTAFHTENATAAMVLSKAGVKVNYSYPARLHAKVIIIDGKLVIDGSTNWSYWALTRNIESASLIRSSEYAKQKLALFEKIESKMSDRNPHKSAGNTVDIPGRLLLDKKLGPKMVSEHDERAFDLYLLLYKQEQNGSEQGGLTFDIDNAAAALGVVGMGREAYRRQIIKTLRKLDNEYGVIHVDFQYSGPAKVTFTTEEKGSAIDVLKVANGYWDYGWSRKLEFPAKFMYFVSLYKHSTADSQSHWSCSQERLSDDFKISTSTVGEGLWSLATNNLLDIRTKSAPLNATGFQYSKRGLSDYKLRPFRSEAEIAKAWQAFVKKHGHKTIEDAKKLAALLNLENNQTDVAKLASALKKYPYAAIETECNKLSTYRRDNPRKRIDYILGILKRKEAPEKG